MKRVLVITLTLVSVLSLVGCGKKEEKNPLVGKWEYSSSIAYVFNNDNTCSYEFYGQSRTCTYEMKDENKLSILYDGDTDPFETTYTIDGKKLIIKDSFDNDVIYTKK